MGKDYSTNLPERRLMAITHDYILKDCISYNRSYSYYVEECRANNIAPLTRRPYLDEVYIINGVMTVA